MRVEELAHALAYWAAYYQALPGGEVLNGDLTVAEAMHRLPRLNQEFDARKAMPREFVQLAARMDSFPAAVRSLAEPESVPAAITALTEISSQLYLDNASLQPLVLLHAVTGPAAVRLLLPHMSPETQSAAFAAIWKCVAAWVIGFSAQTSSQPRTPDPSIVTESQVLERCLETGDVHSIKFVEACLRENTLNQSPLYLEAALDWATRMKNAAGWSEDKKVFAGLAVPDYRPLRGG